MWSAGTTGNTGNMWQSLGDRMVFPSNASAAGTEEPPLVRAGSGWEPMEIQGFPASGIFSGKRLQKTMENHQRLLRNLTISMAIINIINSIQ